MADEITVGLNLDANGYLRTAEEVAKGNRNMADSFENIVGVTRSSAQGLDGIRSVISKTTKGFNEFGDVVTRVAKSVDGELVSVKESVTQVNAAFEEQLAIRNRLREAAKRQAQDADRLTTRTSIERSRVLPKETTQREKESIKDLTDSLLRLQGVAGITGKEIFEALERARAGAITYLNANTKLEKTAFRVAEAERAAGSETKKAAAAQEASAAASKVATTNAQQLIAARRELNRLLNIGFKTDDPNAGASKDRFTAARRAVLNFATSFEKIDEVNAAVIRARSGLLTLENAFEQAEFLALKLVATGKEIGVAEAKNLEQTNAKLRENVILQEEREDRLKAIAAFRDRIQRDVGLDSSRKDVTDDEIGRFRRAKDRFLSNVDSPEAGAQAQQALEEARQGTLRLADARTKLQEDAVRLAQAERDLGKAEREAAQAIRDRTIADEEAESAQKDRLFAAQRLNKAIRQQFDIEKQGATTGEQNQFESARKALVALAESGKVAGATIEAALERAIAGTLTLGNTTDATEEAVVRLVRAGKRLGDQDTKAQAAELKRQADIRKEDLEVLEQEFKIQQQLAKITAATRQGVNLGRGSDAQVRNFVRAEKAALGLASAGKLVGKEFEFALDRARRGTIDFTKQLTEAEEAALEVVAAERQIGQAAGSGGGNPFSRFVDGAADLARVTGIGLFIGNIFRLQGAIEESITDAAELSRKLAELDTIQTQNALSTEAWAKELRELSNTFGIDTLDQAEAAYQTLSNQVAQGAEAIRFLGAANRLAVTGLTDASNAVKLLSSAINAFGIPVGDAETLSAKFFKTVELGRVRIEELSDTFGRVAVPANQLGISFDEVNAAIATLSIQGIKADEAITLLRNIIQKLIRPGKELQETLAELGFNSGQAAIETLGFGGVLAALEERVGGNVEQVGELFQRIRAITGVLGFAGRSAQVYAANLRKIQESNVNEFAEDTNKILQSQGQILKLAAQQAKNYFEETIGTPAINAFADFIKFAGGAEEIIQDLITGFVTLGSAAVAGAAVSKLLALKEALAAGAVAARAAAVANSLLTVSVSGLTGAIGIAVAAASTAYAQSVRNSLRQIEQLAGESAKRVRAVAELAVQQAESEASAIERLGEESRRSFLQGFAQQQAALEQLARAAQVQAEIVESEYKVVNREIVKSVKSLSKEQTKLFNDAKKNAEAAAKAIEGSFNELDFSSLKIDLNVAGFGQQIKFIEDQLIQSRKRIDAAAQSGDAARFSAERKQAERLRKERLEAQISLSQQEAKVREEVIKLEDKLKDASTFKERERIERELRQLRERLQIIRTGTKAQLDGLKQLQAAQNAVEDAQSSTDIRKAEDELKKVEAQQRRINEQVERERKLRQEVVSEAEKYNNQLADIFNQNSRDQEAAEKRRAEIENTRQLLSLISEEAKTFNEEEALKTKNAVELNNLVREQQERFAEILRLQQKLGIAGNAIIAKRAQGLQERAQIALDKLALDGERQKFKAARERLNFEAKEKAKGDLVDRRRVANLTNSLDTLQTQLAKTTGLGSIDDIDDKIDKIAKSAQSLFGVSSPTALGFFDELEGPLARSNIANSFLDLEKRVTDLRAAIETVTRLNESTGTNPEEIALNDLQRTNALAEITRLNAEVAKDVNAFVKLIANVRSVNQDFSLADEPTRQAKAFEQALFNVLQSLRPGAQGVSAISGNVADARAAVVRAIELEQQALARKGIKITEKQQTETEKFLKRVKDLPSALKVFEEVLRQQELQKRLRPVAPGIADIPGLENVFLKGGQTLREQIEQGFATGAEELARAGTEEGRNKAKAEDAERKRQTAERKQQLEEARAARAALLQAQQEDRGISFVNSQGQFIGRGGGQGVDSQGASRGGLGTNTDSAGNFISRGFLEDTSEIGRRIAEATARQLRLDELAKAARAAETNNPISRTGKNAEFFARIAERDAERNNTFGLSTDPIKLRAGGEISRLFQLERAKDARRATGDIPIAPAIPDRTADRAFLQGLVDNAAGLVERSRTDPNVSADRFTAIITAFERATAALAEFDAKASAQDRAARFEAERAEQARQAPVLNPSLERQTGVSVIGDQASRNREARDKVTEDLKQVTRSFKETGDSALSLKQRLDALAVVNPQVREATNRGAFKPQIRPILRGAVTESTSINSNNTTNSNNTNVNIEVKSNEPQATGRAVFSHIERQRRIYGLGPETRPRRRTR